MSLRKAFCYSMLETVFARLLDLITLWIVLNNLSQQDIAIFGLATSSLFFFNLVFFPPETALLRKQKQWEEFNRLNAFLSSFVMFSLSKLALHGLLFALALSLPVVGQVVAYAIIWSAITQLIQLAEIIRINFRMNLRQSLVAKVETISKSILTLVCLTILFYPSLDIYFGLLFAWCIAAAILWLYIAVRHSDIRLQFRSNFLKYIWEASIGFSIWSHISANLVHYIYNSGVLFIGVISKDVAAIALYAVVVRLMNLFFVVPMMVQSFVPVVLSAEGGDGGARFAKLLGASAMIAVIQALFFFVFAPVLGRFFGVDEPAALSLFVELGFIVSVGILVLNLSRPLTTWLMIRIKPHRVMISVFLPAAALATICYPLGIWMAGIKGAAIAATCVYIVMSVQMALLYRKSKRVEMK